MIDSNSNPLNQISPKIEALNEQNKVLEESKEKLFDDILKAAHQRGLLESRILNVCKETGIEDHYSNTTILGGKRSLDVVKKSISIKQIDDKFRESDKQVAEQMTMDAMKEIQAKRAEKLMDSQDPALLESTSIAAEREKELYKFRKEEMDHLKDPKEHPQPSLSPEWKRLICEDLMKFTVRQLEEDKEISWVMQGDRKSNEEIKAPVVAYQKINLQIAKNDKQIQTLTEQMEETLSKGHGSSMQMDFLSQMEQSSSMQFMEQMGVQIDFDQPMQEPEHQENKGFNDMTSTRKEEGKAKHQEAEVSHEQPVYVSASKVYGQEVDKPQSKSYGQGAFQGPASLEPKKVGQYREFKESQRNAEMLSGFNKLLNDMTSTRKEHKTQERSI